MAKNFQKPGRVHSVLVAPYAAVAGAGMQVGSIFGIANADIANGGTGELELEGVFYTAQATNAEAWTEGVALYWNDSGKLFTTTASTYRRVGFASQAKANPSTVGYVRIPVNAI